MQLWQEVFSHIQSCYAFTTKSWRNRAFTVWELVRGIFSTGVTRFFLKQRKVENIPTSMKVWGHTMIQAKLLVIGVVCHMLNSSLAEICRCWFHFSNLQCPCSEYFNQYYRSSGLFFSLRQFDHFLLTQICHWNISVICLTFVSKLAVKVLISLYFRHSDRND